MTLHDIGALADFAPGAAEARIIGTHHLVVIRIDDDMYVLDDRCSHEDFPLSLGEVNVETCEIECERHGAMFQLKDGAPASFPATRPVPRYDVTVSDGRVIVSL